MECFINNQQDSLVVSPRLIELLQKVAQAVAELENLPEEAEVGITLVDDVAMQELNYRYRGLDCATDVLSFALRERTAAEPQVVAPYGDWLLGDIVISVETAQRQAASFAHSLERELCYLAVHGFLHLLGYDHNNEEDTREMRRREEEVLAVLGLERDPE
ncbi:MAG: putative rRNA maturation factor [Clostridia bacterium]|nr:putative rRNA maturation factor [Clostridia bacterium]